VDDFTNGLRGALVEALEQYVSPEEARRQQMRILRERGIVPQRTIAAYEAARISVRKTRPAVLLAPRRDGQRTPRRRALATVRSAPARGDPDSDGELPPPELTGGAPC